MVAFKRSFAYIFIPIHYCCNVLNFKLFSKKNSLIFLEKLKPVQEFSDFFFKVLNYGMKNRKSSQYQISMPFGKDLGKKVTMIMEVNRALCMGIPN